MTPEHTQMFNRLISYAHKIAMNGNGQIAQDIRLCLVDATRYWYLRDDSLQYLISGPICVLADKWGKPLKQYPDDNAELGPATHITIDGKKLDAAIDDARSIKTGR